MRRVSFNLFNLEEEFASNFEDIGIIKRRLG